MRQVMRPLLVLHPDGYFREQVRKGGGKRFDYVQVEEWDALRDLVRSSPPAALIVVDPYVSVGSELSASLRALLLAAVLGILWVAIEKQQRHQARKDMIARDSAVAADVRAATDPAVLAAEEARMPRFEAYPVTETFTGTVSAAAAGLLLLAAASPYVDLTRGWAGIDTVPESDVLSAYRILERDFSAGLLDPGDGCVVAEDAGQLVRGAPGIHVAHGDHQWTDAEQDGLVPPRHRV